MSNITYHKISGKEGGIRLESRVLEALIQKAVENGHTNIEVEAYGQHGIGGRLWKAGDKPVNVKITGASGQRVGSLGFPNTTIEIFGPGSDDVGWLNAGANIIIHGNASNGICNAMAQGKVYIGGNVGSRCMTMTKQNPRFAPPELWVLGSVGDYFGEFMAGGVSVVCGIDAQNPDNVLGYRPLVGMVGGKVFFRGSHKGFSQADSRMRPIDDAEWEWLTLNMKSYLESINKLDLLEKLTVREEWQLIAALTPQEKVAVKRRNMSDFRQNVWDRELGRGGMIGDLTDMDMSPIPVVTTGELRRNVPVWENRKYLAPCEAKCPTGIPVQERWRLIREGNMDEAVDLSLDYSPLPATICGYLCPNLCMQACTRHSAFMVPIDITKLGKASINAKMPDFPEKGDVRVAVVGGGPAGVSVAWQLRKAGHEAVIYDTSEILGGKIASVIPSSRIPADVLATEVDRINKVIPHEKLESALERADLEKMKGEFDFVVIATGAQKPRLLPVPGKERFVTSLDFLLQAKAETVKPGKKIVIIGGGDVGCDVATEAKRFGAEEITILDVQKPAASGEEKEAAEEAGTVFRWPCFTKEVTAQGVVLQDGEVIEADTVVVAIGDEPDLEFLPAEVATENGYVVVNDNFQTTDAKVFAIGDIVAPGLITDAIGAGLTAAYAINDMVDGKMPISDPREMIDTERVVTEYFDPRLSSFEDMTQCGSECSSCGACRDCGICEVTCPRAAITREELDTTETVKFEYAVDSEKCIGCGFCADACPCGIWSLVKNTPLG